MRDVMDTGELEPWRKKADDTQFHAWISTSSPFKNATGNSSFLRKEATMVSFRVRPGREPVSANNRKHFNSQDQIRVIPTNHPSHPCFILENAWIRITYQNNIDPFVESLVIDTYSLQNGEFLHIYLPPKYLFANPAYIWQTYWPRIIPDWPIREYIHTFIPNIGNWFLRTTDLLLYF